MVNDIWGRAQALLDYASMTPDGVQEAPVTSQFLTALKKGFVIGPGIIVNYPKNDTPVAKGDRLLLLQGQEVAIAGSYSLLFAEVYCGDAANPTAPAYYCTNGAGVRTLPGAGGTHLKLPDSRGLGFKNIGDAVINTRTKTGPVKLGEMQEDQGQGHYHPEVYDIGTISKGSNAVGYNDPASRLLGSNASPYGSISIGSCIPTNDGTHGVSRNGDNFRDSTLGTNFGITY
jgi:hypothetical protein